MIVPSYLFSPLPYTVVLALVLVIGWRRIPRACRWGGVALEVLLVVAMAPLGANLLVWTLESQIPDTPRCAVPMPTTVVLLSGGTDRKPLSHTDYAALNLSSFRRLFAAVALWKRTPGARLVIAGGGSPVPESMLLAGLAERLGVPGDAIETEGRSRTTWENALFVSRLQPPVPTRIWLVSTALHLPRAIGAFRAWGFDPCVWSSDRLFVAPRLRLGYFVPQASALEKTNRAIHEIVGGLVYKVLAWKLRNRHAHGDHTIRSTGDAAAATAAVGTCLDVMQRTGGRTAEACVEH